MFHCELPRSSVMQQMAVVTGGLQVYTSPHSEDSCLESLCKVMVMVDDHMTGQLVEMPVHLEVTLPVDWA